MEQIVLKAKRDWHTARETRQFINKRQQRKQARKTLRFNKDRK